MRKQFKNTVMNMAVQDDRIVIILGDVSVYLFNEFKMNHPDRFYNMGISENTLISVGAGLAALGFYPFVHTIAPFITERSYEQIKLDMCYNQFGVNVVSCGASFDYAWDGATHHAYTDLAILRLLPGMEVIQPGSTEELDILLRSQYNNGHSTYFRLSDHPHHIDVPVKFGRGVVIRDSGAEITVMTAGPLLGDVLEACSDLPVNIVYFHTIKPIDTQLIHRFRHTRIVVVHDAFGLKEAICEVPEVRVVYHGMPDAFCTSYGTLPDIRRQLQLDPAGIREFVADELRRK
jgi:transketolase